MVVDVEENVNEHEPADWTTILNELEKRVATPAEPGWVDIPPPAEITDAWTDNKVPPWFMAELLMNPDQWRAVEFRSVPEMWIKAQSLYLAGAQVEVRGLVLYVKAPAA